MPKSSAHQPYLIKITNIKKCSSKDFYGNEEKFFWLSARKVTTQNWKFFAQCPKVFGSMSGNGRKNIFPNKKTLSCGHVDCSYSNFPENILTNGRIFFAECNETVKKKNFLKMIFLRVFLWTSKKHFWKSCYFFVSEARKNFAEISKT